jgi:Ca-activated chloride channel family protein
MFRFASPYFLLLLALVPATVWYGLKRARPAALADSGMGSSGPVTRSAALRTLWLPPALFYLALILMIASLARPQWGTRRMVVNTSGINIILAIDLSKSMEALDFKQGGNIINRLEAVKSVVRDFVRHRDGDRIGMVVFGSAAYTQLPLTRDYNTIATMLEHLQIGAAGRSTAIGDAIGISLKRLEDIESKSNIIILLTDGRSNSGEFEPRTTAAIAKEKGVKIYTIGVGSKGRAPFPVDDPVFGRRFVYQRVDIDEPTLKAVARQTGGKYFRAQDLEGLQEIYATIDKLEKTEVKMKTFADYNELYFYLLLPAFGLLALWIILVNTRYLRIP